ncbi:hypothetical protein N431DRAFT_446724 [Stipitochalara longipes BDJ]|nr:hypothetical protein N431DRAFT_446724 [Stipitochalara longipes BDJ]
MEYLLYFLRALFNPKTILFILSATLITSIITSPTPKFQDLSDRDLVLLDTLFLAIMNPIAWGAIALGVCTGVIEYRNEGSSIKYCYAMAAGPAGIAAVIQYRSHWDIEVSEFVTNVIKGAKWKGWGYEKDSEADKCWERVEM